MLSSSSPRLPASTEAAPVQPLLPTPSAALRALAVVGLTLLPFAALLTAAALRWLR